MKIYKYNIQIELKWFIGLTKIYVNFLLEIYT